MLQADDSPAQGSHDASADDVEMAGSDAGESGSQTDNPAEGGTDGSASSGPGDAGMDGSDADDSGSDTESDHDANDNLDSAGDGHSHEDSATTDQNNSFSDTFSSSTITGTTTGNEVEEWSSYIPSDTPDDDEDPFKRPKKPTRPYNKNSAENLVKTKAKKGLSNRAAAEAHNSALKDCKLLNRTNVMNPTKVRREKKKLGDKLVADKRRKLEGMEYLGFDGKDNEAASIVDQDTTFVNNDGSQDTVTVKRQKTVKEHHMICMAYGRFGAALIDFLTMLLGEKKGRQQAEVFLNLTM